MKYSIIILILFLSCPVVSAQQVVSSSGDSQSAAGVEVSWTLGEAVIETLFGGSSTLTQGFHQTRLTVTAVTNLLYPGLEIKVFPNPTQEFITIRFSEYIEDTRYSIYDLRGKLIDNKLINSADTEIDLKKYASGQYILRLTNKSQQAIQTFQVIKY